MPTENRFLLGSYWLDREPKSPNWLRCWYDPGARKVRRRSLATRDLAEAKVRLAAFVLHTSIQVHHTPDAVPFAMVLKHYWETYSDLRPYRGNARRAGELLLDFLGDDAKVGDLTKSRQEAFMRWLAGGFGHSVATISRNLAIINAALRRALEPYVVQGPDGHEVERQILQRAPKVYYDARHISEVVDKPEPRPRTWRPSLEQLGAFIDAIECERLFRYIILALNTWARPEAICDLRPELQIDQEHRLLDLNPPDRRQTKKYRPTIRITDCLWGWLQAWPQTRPLLAIERKTAFGMPGAVPTTGYQPVRSVRNAFVRTRERAGVPELTRYSLRHLMASRVAASTDPVVPDRQIDLWMGHTRQRPSSAKWYEHYEPGYLLEAKRVTDGFMVELQQRCRCSLFAPSPERFNRPRVIPQIWGAPAA